MPIEIFVDQDFADIEKQEIQKAFDAWTIASSGLVSFRIHWDAPKPGRFYNKYRAESGDGIFFWQIEFSNYNDLTEDMRPEFENFHGLFIPGKNYSANLLVLTDLTDRDHFYQVATHEIGHLLGLEHITDNKDAIMFPHATGPCITKKDMEQLCDIYNCVPLKYCVTIL